MHKASVLVVDDSVVVRRMLSRIIDELPGFAVAASAASGPAALEFLNGKKIDLVTLDVEMEPMNGLEVLDELKRRGVRVPVLMLSSLTSAGTDVTLDALLRGAADYIQKPTAGAPRDRFASELRAKLCELVAADLRSDGSTVQASNNRIHRPNGRFSRVAIGASTGGPEALTTVLRGLPGDFPVPVFVVQHMPPQFTAPFAERLNAKCAVSVTHAEDGMSVEPGVVYIAPGGRHMLVTSRRGDLRLELNDQPLLHGCRPAFDHLLQSLSKHQPEQTLVALLTGMGRDGSDGALELRNRGATVLAQDKESSVVWGMPGSAVRLNAVDRVIPLAEVAPTIERMCHPVATLAEAL